MADINMRICLKKLLTNHQLYCLHHIDKQFELQTSSIKQMADVNVHILYKHFDESLISLQSSSQR